MKKKDLAIFGGAPVRRGGWVWKSSIGEEEKKALEEVIDSGRLSVFRGGPKVRVFENAFSKYSGAEHGVATSSGTTALHTAVSALGIKEGDEVLVPPLTFVSTASVVLQQNATPVFVDIDPETYCMSPDDMESKVTDKTRAVIPVHIYGRPCDMESIVDIASRNDLYVIADAAQAHGAQISGEPLGSFGDCSCYSFFQTKILVTGEGGMVITNQEDVARKLRLKREHGSSENPVTWYKYDELGFNYAMTEMQAAVGLAQLKKLDKNIELRRRNAQIYFSTLTGFELTLPYIDEKFQNVFHNFPILLPRYATEIRDEFVAAVRAEGVPIDVCYPIPLYKTNLFRGVCDDAYCPNAEDVASRIVTVFVDPVLTEQDINDISDAVKKVSVYYLG